LTAFKSAKKKQKKASWGTRTRTEVTAGRVEHADHPAVQPHTFTGVYRLTALLFISRQAVRSCLGSFFAKRVHISPAPEIDAHWSVVFGKLDENGAFLTVCSLAYFA